MLRPRLFSFVKLFHSAAPVVNAVQEESLNEKCLLVDTNDKVIGSASKRDCHRVMRDGSLPLHRAFSLILFNSNKEIVLQRRSDTKVTFPGHFTNTCCSHPLLDFEDEQIEEDALGVKNAAIRRLNHELGVPLGEVKHADLKYITRFIYKSLGDGVWGEHELDYILVMKKDLDLKPNPEEVSDICFVSQNDFRSFLTNLKDPVSPWFQLIVKNQLIKLWWDNLDSLERIMDHKKIHSFS